MIYEQKVGDVVVTMNGDPEEIIKLLKYEASDDDFILKHQSSKRK